jgi:hypothetical protein
LKPKQSVFHPGAWARRSRLVADLRGQLDRLRDLLLGGRDLVCTVTGSRCHGRCPQQHHDRAEQVRVVDRRGERAITMRRDLSTRIDRMYCNVYAPELQYPAGLVAHVHRQLGLPIASTASTGWRG